jgi:hypothetical protein
MNRPPRRWLPCALSLCLLQVEPAHAARDNVEVRAYVNDSCIIADEPYFVPASGNQAVAGATDARFLPLLGVVVGKLAELYINHEIQAYANRMKARASRKDTRYAASKQMNLYRADFQPVPTISINGSLGCMTIVAGSFKPASIDCTAQYVPKELSSESLGLPQAQWRSARTDDSIENKLRRAHICVDGKARAVYESRFEFSPDRTAYRLKDAGYQIEALLTTTEKGASRAALYTLKISNPTTSDQQQTLTSAWVNLGTVSAGAKGSGSADDASPWLQVPPLSVEARRAYETQSKTQQEVMGEIEALQRALTRNQRLIVGIEQRMSSASAEVAAGLMQERTRVQVQIQAQEAELDARNAEYQDLPHAPLEFMPVTIEVAVTETESEQKAKLALADIIGSNSDIVASAVGDAANGLVSKSLSVNDLQIQSAATPADELERARARYYDALVEVRTGSVGSDGEQAGRNLAAARTAYNQARHAMGLEQIE